MTMDGAAAPPSVHRPQRRRPFPCRRSFNVSSLFFFLALSLLLSARQTNAAAADWFDFLDVNHDGLIDRSEYQDGITKLEQVVQNPLPLSTSPSWFSWGSSSALSSWITWRGFWKAFTKALGMIVATEIGDKTFFIASVLSMRHDRSSVFCGALLALVIMTILSAALGRVLPSLLPVRYTHFVAGLLFLYFGIRLILESRTMSKHQVSAELEHVEEELLGSSQKSKKKLEDMSPSNSNIGDLESCTPHGTTGATTKLMSSSSKPVSSTPWSTIAIILAPFYHQVIWQALSLTFLAEWGDRSQIATIALSAAYNPTGVVIGGILGHALCTGLAVLGGRMLAARISEKVVAQYGGLLFLLFGLHSIFFEAATTTATAAVVTSNTSAMVAGTAAANAAGIEGAAEVSN